MTRTVNTLTDFDGPRDASRYMDSLAAQGVPYERVDEDTIVVFDDEADREKWLEIASAPGGLFERQARRRALKDAVDRMPDAEVDRMLEDLGMEEMS